jgi:hypothetical protein
LAITWPANGFLYGSSVIPFGRAGFRNLDNRITSVTEKQAAGCRPTRPLAVAGEERAEPPLHHRCSRDNRSDGGDHDHSQREPCDPCLPLLAHLRAARVIDQPLLCTRASVQPRAGEEGASPVIGDQVVVIGGTQGRCYSGRACRVPASVPSVGATRPTRRKWGVFHVSAFPSFPLSPPHLPPRSATISDR